MEHAHADTTGKRLRYFSETFFTSITAFAHELGYQKPGSLYDYFNDRKKPGGHLLDRFRTIGGDPNWLRYGVGSMFADNDAGHDLRSRYQARLPYPISGGNDSAALEPRQAYTQSRDIPLEEGEAIYALLGRILYRIRRSQALSPEILALYREQLDLIGRQLDTMDAANQA